MKRHAPRLIILEGLMGSGKSTTCRWLAGQLRGNRIPVTVYGNRNVWGRTPPDALRSILEGTSEPSLIWSRLRPDDLIERSRRAWTSFVAEATARGGVSLFDGRFFHADLAGLMMLEADEPLILEHARWMVQVSRSLDPRMVYLHAGEVGESLRRISRIRGSGWAVSVSSRRVSQAPWSLARLESPYCRNRSLTGVEGSIAFYREYASLCLRLLPRLELPNIVVDTSSGDWRAVRTSILQFLGLRPTRDFRYLAWWISKRPRVWLSRALGDLRAGDPADL